MTPGQLRPYSHVQLLASACEAVVDPKVVAWPADDTFQYNGVVRESPGLQVHWHDMHRFCTTSTLQFFLYRTRCRASILVQQYRMNKPLAALMRALFTRGIVGYYHSSEHPLPDPILNNPIRIVDLNGTTWWEEFGRTFGAEDLGRMYSDVEDAWANMLMDPVLLKKGALTMEEGLLVCHFLEYAVRRGTYPAQSAAVVTTHYAQIVWLDFCVRFVGRKWQANPVNLSENGCYPQLVPGAASLSHPGLPGVPDTRDHARHLAVKHLDQQGALGAAPLRALYRLDHPPHPWCMARCTAGGAVGSRLWDCERHS